MRYVLPGRQARAAQAADVPRVSDGCCRTAPWARGRGGSALAWALPLLAGAHIGPAVTWLPPVRRSFFPGLAGLGRPDHVALTFDDGPDPLSTPAFLRCLDDLGVRATFFVMGTAVGRHPALCRAMADAGHELAVHGWSHTRPWYPGPRDVREVALTVAAIGGATGKAPVRYRPPYGILSSGRWAAARRCGLRTVLWSAWGRDWAADATPDSVLARIVGDLRGGGTVLLHDTDRYSAPGSWRTTLAALPALVELCRARGWEAGPLAEHEITAPPPRAG